MKLNKLFAGAFMTLLGLPMVTFAQSDPVVINGSVIDWYYYGNDPHNPKKKVWVQAVPGKVGQPSTIGLMTWGLDSTATDGRPVWLQDFPIRHNMFYANQGGVFTGDAYYTFTMGEQNYENSMDSEYGSETYTIKVYKWTWDEGYTNVKYQKVGNLGCSVTDLTYDPIYDKVYGMFATSSGYKLGELDLETMKVRYISRESMALTSEFRALAINSKGVLYGIDASGNVATISKTDGSINYIGNVGFKSQRRMMSATFDLRTDKLYWLGFMNNGKSSADPSGTNTTLSVADGGRDTGFYEIDTTTGKATLIGTTDGKPESVWNEKTQEFDTKREGKFQLTGIYVEGSFTKKNVDQSITLTSVPSQMKIGETGTITVKVKNIGLTEIDRDDYQVNLYVNGIKAEGPKEGKMKDLEKSESREYTFTINAAQVGKLEIYAEVVNGKDEEALNNKTEVAQIIVLSDKVLPTVVLSGKNRLGSVNLTWNDPKGHVCDGAEQYAAFSYDGLGAWTMVDGDKGYTQSANNFNGSINYPNKNNPKAFIVFDPIKAGFDLAVGGTKFAPHNGSQYFAGWFSAMPDDSEAGGHEVDNDDYMVSPTLSGNAQTISFWAKGYRGTEAAGYQTDMIFNETMEVLYTNDADNLNPTTYQVAKEQFSVNDQAWEQYTADLPAGAKHFALHRTSKAAETTETELGAVTIPGTGSYVMMIDDIEFQIEPLTVTGYNVYKNGEKIATLEASTVTYNATNAADTDLFTVTAIYAEGESANSNPFSIAIVNSIEPTSIMAADNGINGTFDLNGRLVKGQLRPGIYVVKNNGKTNKIIIK